MRYRCYTGPCAVKEVAAALETLGVASVLAGTEHVYFTATEPLDALIERAQKEGNTLARSFLSAGPQPFHGAKAIGQ